MTKVPLALRARRLHLPALAWVVSMAYCPARPSWLRRLRGAVGCPAWLVVLLIALPLGSVCAVDRHAVFIAQDRQEPAGLRARRTLLAVPVAVLATVAVLVIPALVATELVWWSSGWERTSPWYSWCLLVGTMTPIVAAVLGMRPVRAVRGGTMALQPVVDELANAALGQPVWLLSLLAAWPQNQGHGRRLLRTALDPSGLPGSIVLVARDDLLVKTYRRYGMQCPGRGRVMTRPAGRLPA